MNPSQAPGTPTPGSQPMPPVAAPQMPNASTLDIPEDNAFGFADDRRPMPAPAPMPQQPVQMITPVQPQPPATPTPQPAPQMAEVMPPQSIPAVPTLSTPVPQATPVAPAPAVIAVPQPAPIIVPAPQPLPPPTPVPVTIAAPPPPPPIQLGEDFDPSTVPVHASSTPENPLTNFSAMPVTHISDEIANRIGEHPMQNSGDIMKQVKHGLEGNKLKSLFSIVLFAAGIFVAAFLINQFVFQSYYVEGTSMAPTLANNDRLIISKVERTLSGIQGKPYIPERGQIVVLDSSIVGTNGQKVELIKRVIGLPGDKIHIESGTVIITNAQHPNGYDVTKDLGLTNLQATHSDGIIDVTVPEGQVYVMGDNREQGGSFDSRSFGSIEGNKIEGRLWARLLPIEQAQLY